MDTGEGRFKLLDDKSAAELLNKSPAVAAKLFRIGETIRIKDSFFRVKAIKPKGLTLKLLSGEQSRIVRKTEEHAAARDSARAFVRGAEVAEEAKLMRMLVAEDKVAAYEMLKELKSQYLARLQRIEEKLVDLADDLTGFRTPSTGFGPVDFDPISEAIDALAAEDPDRGPEFEAAEQVVDAMIAEEQWQGRLNEDRCLRHDFSEDRQICRVCGLTIEDFLAEEEAAEEALRQMRDELLGKEAP